jgi:Protein of unknown function (DUF2997).
MSQKEIVVRVGRDGSIDAETFGMHGDECLDYFDALESLLDAEVVDSSFTDDYARSGAAVESTAHTEDRA